MKKILAIVLMGLALGSCNKPMEEQVVTTKLTGVITNPKSNMVKLTNKEFDLIDTLSDVGSFAIELVINKPTYFTFRHGDEIASIYLNSGDSLNLSLDTNNFDESLTFSGNSKDQNQYMVAKVLSKDTEMGFRELYGLNEEDFLLTTDSIQTKYDGLLAGSMKVSDDSLFYYTEKKKNELETILNKARYENNHKYATNDTTFKVSEDYYVFFDDLDRNNESLLSIPLYRYALDTYIDYKFDGFDFDYKKDPIAKAFNHRMDIIGNEFSNEKVKLELMAMQADRYLSRVDASSAEQALDKIKAMDTDKKYIADLEEKWGLLKKVAVGQPVPNLQFVNTSGDSLSLADLKGKMVYIDVWATWCGPCLAELPSLEKLQVELKDREVTFMSVSIDDTMDPWKKMVEKKEMKGIQVYSPGAWKSDIITSFVINGIPRFILIDKNGIILDNDASRPSGDIKEVILKNLNSEG
ncbi:MAG TPA: TlpA disulfide reductase family protein [Fulvivirga sp.]|nr:TlpA disulfide reductase family protein [Fulvivirga sp.]